MILASWIIGAIAASLLLLAATAFLKAKDVFVMIHIVKISNFYIIPLILLAATLERFSLLSLAKVLVIIVLNIVISNLLCHVIAKRAITNKIVPDADFKKNILWTIPPITKI